MEDRHYNKLVRDHIPEIIESKGEKCSVEPLSYTDYLKALDDKLHEEVAEWMESHDIEELADIVEVVEAMLEARQVTESQFTMIRGEKLKSKGGFERRLLLKKIYGTTPDEDSERYGRNPNFPNWPSANIVLTTVIAPLIGGYAKVIRQNEVKLSMFPGNVMNYVPREYADRFMEIVNKFHEFAYKELNLEEFINSYLYTIIDDNMYSAIKEGISCRIDKYNHTHQIPFQKEFLRFMGIDPVVNISCRMED